MNALDQWHHRIRFHKRTGSRLKSYEYGPNLFLVGTDSWFRDMLDQEWLKDQILGLGFVLHLIQIQIRVLCMEHK